MSGRSAYRDPTANKAVRHVDRGSMKHHAPGCVVNGGTQRHGLRGYQCIKCGGTPEQRLERLLYELDRQVDGRW